MWRFYTALFIAKFNLVLQNNSPKLSLPLSVVKHWFLMPVSIFYAAQSIQQVWYMYKIRQRATVIIKGPIAEVKTEIWFTYGQRWVGLPTTS